MAISTILTVGGTAYTAAQRAAAEIGLNELLRVLDGGYDTLTFTERSLAPAATFALGQTAALALDLGNGAGSVTYFTGTIVDLQSMPSAMAWEHGYTALGLRWMADQCPVTAVDGTGSQTYNGDPNSPWTVSSDTGLTVGTILTRLLTIPATANALNASGVGGYTSLSPPTLPTATVNDFALLTVVPPSPVICSSESLFTWMCNLVQRWMPKYCLYVERDGLIRCKNMTDTAVFVPQTFTVAGPGGPADPVTWPAVRASIQDCATRIVLRGGPQVEAAMLSLTDGTLAEGFTSSDKSSWNLYAFTQPNGAVDWGTVTACTSNSATLQSHSNTVTWAVNFWSGNNAWVHLYSNVNTGINVQEDRIVTSNNALAAAGTSTVNWDANWPITNTNYTAYRIVGSTGGLIDCWRLYKPREPATGNTGLNTWIGAHLVPRSSKVVHWANSDTSLGVYYSTMMVFGGSVTTSIPWPMEVVPSLGAFRARSPTVQAYGSTTSLQSGSPTTVAAGLPSDVQVLALYSRGALSVTVPADVGGVPQYQGTAFTAIAYKNTKYLDYPNWMWVNDTSSFTALAQQHLDPLKNTVFEGSIDWYDLGSGPTWDWLSFGYSVNIAIQGATSPWSAINATVRTIKVRWCKAGEPALHVITFGFSNRMKPFSGDDLYVHPQFAQGSPLSNAFAGAGGNAGAYMGALMSGQLQGAAGGTSFGNFGRFAPGNMAAMGPGNMAGFAPDQGAWGPGNLGAWGPQGMGMGGFGDGSGGFGLGDTLAAGMDWGAGVSDPESRRVQDAQDAQRLGPPRVRTPREISEARQRRNVARTRQAMRRAAQQQRIEAMRRGRKMTGPKFEDFLAAGGVGSADATEAQEANLQDVAEHNRPDAQVQRQIDARRGANEAQAARQRKEADEQIAMTKRNRERREAAERKQRQADPTWQYFAGAGAAEDGGPVGGE